MRGGSWDVNKGNVNIFQVWVTGSDIQKCTKPRLIIKPGVEHGERRNECCDVGVAGSKTGDLHDFSKGGILNTWSI